MKFEQNGRGLLERLIHSHIDFNVSGEGSGRKTRDSAIRFTAVDT